MGKSIRNHIRNKSKRKKRKNTSKTPLTGKQIAARIALCLLCVSIVFTAGLFFYTAYRLTGTPVPTMELFDGRGTVRFVDVGQGDCTLVTWQGDALLIDAGTGSSGRKAAEYIKMYAPSVDCMIITHPHEDHMGGAEDILKSVKVDKLILSDIVVEDDFYSAALEAAELRGTEIVTVNEGTKFTAGSISVEILDTFGLEYEDLNDASLAVKVMLGETEILITGDAELAEEAYLVENCRDQLDSDILKVGHHGSRSSTGEDFLASVSPEICVISVGRNNTYGHPTDEVIDRISGIGAELHRTDREGHVVLRSDGPSGKSLSDAWRKLWGD